MQVAQNRFLLLTLIMSMALLAGFGVDLYAPSLPALSVYFQAPASSAQIALAIYLLGFSVGQPVFGTLSDCYGRKRFLIFGVLLYIVASFAAIFATTIKFLIGMRFLQGLGGSACSAINKAILSDCIPSEELTNYATYMTIGWGIGPIIAPVIGGYLQEYLGWQSAFWLQAIQAALLFLLIITKFTETNNKLRKFRLSDIATTYLTIIKHKMFVGLVLLMAITYSLVIIFNVVSPFLIQNKLGYTVIQYGHIALIIGLAYFLGNICNRMVVNYIAVDLLINSSIYLSLIIAIAAVICAYLLPLSLGLLTIPSFILFYLGGMIFPNCMGKGMGLFNEVAGAASAVMGCCFVLGTFIAGYIASLLNAHSIIAIGYAYLVLCLGFVLVKFLLLSEKQHI